MSEILEPLSSVAVLVFVASGMAAAGMTLSRSDLRSAFARPIWLGSALFANFVLAPAIAVALTWLVALPTAFESGLLLLAAAAGAPFLPKLTAAAKVDGPDAVILMVVLMLASVIYLPLAIPRLIPGVTVSTWPILQPLLATMIGPMFAGVFLRSCMTGFWPKIYAFLQRLSTVAMLVAVVLLLVHHRAALLATFGTGAALTGAAFVLLAYGAGYLCGGTAPAARTTMALGTAQRNVAAAMVIATQSFPDPGVAIMLLVTTFAGLILLLIVIRSLRPSRNPLGAAHEP